MSTLVDSNVLIDLIDATAPWHEWSKAQMLSARLRGSVIVNQVVLAETSETFEEPASFDPFASQAGLTRESIPWQACYEAGKAHVAYRQRGGLRERTLPDFLIGAHAVVMAHQLLTRDGRRYRTYFPGLEIIAPDTHP